MRVFGHYTDGEKFLTSPYPEDAECLRIFGVLVGAKARLMGGDLLSPDIKSGRFRPGREHDKGRNFFSVIPTRVKREVTDKPTKPFASVRIGRFAFYVGHKVYGVSAPEYVDFPLVQPKEVFDGSFALSGFTWRATTKKGVKP